MSKARILSLLDVQKQKQASKIVASVKFEKTLLILCEYFTQENGENSVILLRAVFLGLEEDNSKKNEIIKKIFALVNSNEIETKVTNDLIGFIVSELEKFPIKELVVLIDFFLDSIDKGEMKSSKSLELMSKILSITSVLPKVCHIDSVMSGEDYHKMIIDEICQKKWAEESILPLVTGLRDIDLKEVSLKQVIDKVLRLPDEDFKYPVVQSKILISGLR